VIIEILSPTTEAFDRGVKFVRLRNWNDSLREYVLISQTEPLVEIYRRGEGATWSFEPFAALEAVVPLASIGCKLPLADVYDRVVFPPPENVA
jgi:Uma2 family endonuclease